MIKFYVIFSLVCAVVIMNGVSLLLKRVENEFDLGTTKFSEFLFSAYGIRMIIVSFIPIINFVIVVLCLFYPNKLYDAVADGIRNSIKK